MISIGSSIHLRPIAWQQQVQHFTNIKIEGRRFSANCEVEESGGLRLSNGMEISGLPVSILIFETTRMRDHLAKLPEGSIGTFSFRGGTTPQGEFDGSPFLSGWFVLNAQSLEDAWAQVLHGGYSQCSLTLHIGPLEDDAGTGFLWDVKKLPHLNVESVTLSFARTSPQGNR